MSGTQQKIDVASVPLDMVRIASGGFRMGSADFYPEERPVREVSVDGSTGRFMSMIAIDEEQYALETVYGPGTFTYAKETVGSRYVLLGLRTFVDPNDPKDVDKVHALQDAVTATQNSTGRFAFPNWDPVSQKQVRDELIKRAASIPDVKDMFGPRGKVDSERHLIGSSPSRVKFRLMGFGR